MKYYLLFIKTSPNAFNVVTSILFIIYTFTFSVKVHLLLLPFDLLSKYCQICFCKLAAKKCIYLTICPYEQVALPGQLRIGLQYISFILLYYNTDIVRCTFISHVRTNGISTFYNTIFNVSIIPNICII